MSYAINAAVTADENITTRADQIANLQREANAAHRRILTANTKDDAICALAQIVRLKQKQIAIAAI